MLHLTRGGVTADDTIGWDPEAGRIDAPALEGIDAIVHLAGEGIGEHRWSDEQKRRSVTSRVRGTAVLAAAVASRERKPSVFVSGSAIGYYGNRGDEVLDRGKPAGQRLPGPGLRRVGSRDETGERGGGSHRADVRTGIVLDKHGGALAKMLLPFRLGIGGAPGLGQAVDELGRARRRGAARSAMRSTTKPVRGPINIAAPNPVTNADFAHALGEVLHRPTDPADAVAAAEGAPGIGAGRERCCSRASGSRPPDSRPPATNSGSRSWMRPCTPF